MLRRVFPATFAVAVAQQARYISNDKFMGDKKHEGLRKDEMGKKDWASNDMKFDGKGKEGMQKTSGYMKEKEGFKMDGKLKEDKAKDWRKDSDRSKESSWQQTSGRVGKDKKEDHIKDDFAKKDFKKDGKKDGRFDS